VSRELPVISRRGDTTSAYRYWVRRFTLTVQREKLTWGLIGLWTLGMISLPIVLWMVGDDLLPKAVTITTALQALAVGAVLGKAWGWRRLIATLVSVAVLGWLVEYIGSTSGIPFGAYAYTELLQPHLLGVPLLIPVAWFMLLPCAWTIAGYLAGGRLWMFVLLSVLAFVAWDLFLDPQMVIWDLWRWTQPGGYFGIPWSNYAGWALAALVMTLIVGPPQKPLKLLLVIYGLTWFFEVFGLLFFWGLVGPALVGGVVMGAFLIAAVYMHLRIEMP
jgi:lycopene beta-cyclase